MGFSTYIRMLLSQICLGTSAGEIKWILHLHAHALRDCVVHVLYELPCIVHKVSMCRAEHSDHQNVPFVSLRMIIKTTI